MTTATRALTDEELAGAYQVVLDDCADGGPVSQKLQARLQQLAKPREHKAIEFLARHPELTRGAYDIAIYYSEIKLQVRRGDFVPSDDASLDQDATSSYDEYVATIDGFDLRWVVA